MKRTVIFLVLLFSGIYLCIAQPSLEIIGGNTYEFPYAYMAENPLYAKIMLKNKGDKLLRVEYIKPSCSCTTAPLEKSSLEPGETMLMNVQINMKGFSGKITKTVEIKTNDPEEPITVVTILFEVKQPFELSPRGFFAFKALKIDSVSKSKLELRNVSEQKIVLSDFVVKPEDVKVNLKGTKVLNPNQKVNIEIKVNPKAEGPYSCSLKMKTTHPEAPELVLYGSGRVIVQKAATEEEKPEKQDKQEIPENPGKTD